MTDIEGDSLVIRRIVALLAMSVMLSGCFIAPMAFLGPATSGFTTASIIQSTITTSAGYMVKKSTGKSITEHVLDSIQIEDYQHSFVPKNIKNKLIYSDNKNK